MVFVQKINFAISITETSHLLKCCIWKTNLWNESLKSFAHYKHWEVVTLLNFRISVFIINILKNGAECFLELSVCNSFMTITSNIDSIDFVKHWDDFLIRIEEWNWNNNYSTLFKELDVSFWDIWNIFSDFEYFSSIVFASHISSKWFSKNTINRSSIVTDINYSIFPKVVKIIFWSKCIT